MKSTNTTQELSACPVCSYPLTSSWHLAGCEMSRAQVVEVCPPDWTRPECWHEAAAEPTGLFPLASIAHELKTPMVVMLGYADLLRNGQLGQVNTKQRDILGDMHESGERLQRLITNVLRLCELRHRQPESDKAMESSEVNQQMRMIFAHWMPIAKKKSIRYEFLTASDDCWIRMNPIDFHLAVSNLIENALKYTPEKGSVVTTIRTCFWEDQEAQGRLPFEGKTDRKVENAVQIEIRDSGPGVPSEQRQEIFKDFVRLPGKLPGHGLGLAIARRLVMSHGGRIWVEPGYDRGSTFSILLPIMAHSIQQPPASM